VCERETDRQREGRRDGGRREEKTVDLLTWIPSETKMIGRHI